MHLADQLEHWHDFYLATAAAAAVLMGVLFVAFALRRGETALGPILTADRFHGHFLISSFFEPLLGDDPNVVVLGGKAYVMYIYALFFSFGMLLPVTWPFLPALGMSILGLAGLAETMFPFVDMQRKRRQAPSPGELLGRYLFPVIVMTVMCFCAVGLVFDSSLVLPFYALGVGGLLGLGTRFSFEMLLEAKPRAHSRARGRAPARATVAPRKSPGVEVGSDQTTATRGSEAMAEPSNVKKSRRSPKRTT